MLRFLHHVTGSGYFDGGGRKDRMDGTVGHLPMKSARERKGKKEVGTIGA